MKFGRAALAAVLLAASALAQETVPPAGGLLDDQERLIRARYEQVLSRNPFQENAFDRVYEGYMLAEGAGAWLEKLAAPAGEEPPIANLVLRGRILARQLRHAEAIVALAEARERGESRPELDRVLGQLYYEEGRDAQAIELLSSALDAVTNPDERARLCRVLGNVYLRAGKQAEAVAAWERLVETAPGDPFALQELAEIYEANRLWEAAAKTYGDIAAAAVNDPYRKCRAFQSLGKARLAMEDYGGAIAAFEAGLELAAPGNWLFEDLKGRLVSVYDAMGDLDGLATYLQARLEGNPADLEFQELLAETHMRRGDMVEAEAVLRGVLSRSPDRRSAFEMLIRLYDREERLDDLAATYETLITRFPADTDYLRRLGEAYLQNGQPDQALATWRRLAGPDAEAQDLALLAEWLERYEFFPEAAEAYLRAIATRPDREWSLRLASLRYDMGEESEALAAWQASVAGEDTPAAELAEVAAILFSRKFPAEARALYERAMATAPDNLEIVLAYARLLVNEEDHEAALPYFERLAAQDENEYLKATGEQGLLEAYIALDTIDEQRTLWERAVAESPDDIAPRLRLARLYARSGNRPGAVKLYEECAAAAPDHVEIRRRLAEAYRLNRKNDAAIQTLEHLMEADPARAGGYLRELLALYAAANNKDEAIAAAERLVEMAPGSPEARSELAAVYMRYNEREEALQQYRNLIHLDDDEPAYYREFGDALLRSGRVGEAGEVFRKMLETAADRTVRLDAVNRLAGVYVRLGKGDTLADEFQARVRATPKNLAAYEELAAVHRAAGDRKAAMDVVESARDEVEDREAFLRLILSEAYDTAEYSKVVSAYEELIALSGEPSVHELDRLARAHANAGNLDEAVAVWEQLAAAHHDDARAQLSVARALREQGFYDEAQPYLERALEIDPYDYTLRFQYAQDLLNRGEPAGAAEQLRLILAIGDRPPAEDGTVTQPASQLALGGRSWLGSGPILQRPSAFGGPSFGGGMAGSGIYRSGLRHNLPVARGTISASAGFEGIKRQVLQMEVQMAQRNGDVDPVLEAYQTKAESDPDNIDARYDYLAVCELAGQQERALDVAQGLASIYPDDSALLWRIFGLQQQSQQPDAAIATAEMIAAGSDRNMAAQALMSLVTLHLQRDAEAEASSAMTRLEKIFPGDAQIHLRLGHTLQQAGRMEDAERHFEKAVAIEPTLRVQIDLSLAQLHQAQGETDQARERYMAVLFHDTDPAAAVPAARNPRAPRVHLPQYHIRGGSRPPSGNLARLPGAGFQINDRQREQAFNQILHMSLDDATLEPVRERLRTEAAQYASAESPDAEARAADFLALYVAYIRNTQGAEAALAELRELTGEKINRLLAQNFTLYLLEDLGDLDAMASLYDEIASNPAVSAVHIAQARLNLALAAQHFENVGERYRDYVAAGGNRTLLRHVARVLDQGGAQDLSLTLLEDELRSSRDAETLNLLSSIYSGRGDHDRAIALAREAWQLQSGANSRLGSRHRRFNYARRQADLQSLGLQHLLPLWNAHERAGRRAELVEAFEDRLAGQPNAISLHLALVGLHGQNGRGDLALRQMEKLVSLRPNDFKLRLQYTGLLEANGDKAASLEILEQVAREQAGGWQAYGSQIQRLYRELNKTEELASLQERMIAEARTPQQMHELAQRFANEREFGKAADLLADVIRMEPGGDWLRLQVADYYWRDGQQDKALDAYLAGLKAPNEEANMVVLDRGLARVVSRFEEGGRLDELKALAAGAAPYDAAIPRWRLLAAHIAMHEQRYSDAEALLSSMLEAGEDELARSMLANMAEKQGDFDKAIQHVEKLGMDRRSRNYQRLATLYLKKGDVARAVESLKAHAELQGGFQGHNDAVQTLLRGGAVDEAEAYVLEVIDRLPAGDWAYRQIADTVLREHVERGRFHPETIDRVFGKENPHTGQFAERLTSDFHTRPKQARKRLAPIAARFPDNERVQSRYAEILAYLGAYEEAIPIFKRLANRARKSDAAFIRYVDLLGKAGRHEARMAALAGRLDGEHVPDPALIALVSRVYREAGDMAALTALRERLVASAAPGERARIEAAFVKDGGPGEARAALRAQAVANASDANVNANLQYLAGQGLHGEAATFFDAYLAEGAAQRLSPQQAGMLAPSLIAAGEAETAWELLLETSRRDRNSASLQGRIRDAMRQMRDFGVSTRFLQERVAALQAEDSFALDERLFAARVEAHLGHADHALDLLDLPVRDGRLEEAVRTIEQGIPPELQRSHLDEADGTVDGRQQQMEQALRAAGEELRAGNTAGAMAILDLMQVTGETVRYRAQRARQYLEAAAYDKAIADCRVVLESEPDNERITLCLALALAESGQQEDALAAWRDTAGARWDRDALRLATIFVDDKFYRGAQAILDASAGYRAPDPVADVLTARILHETGRDTEIVATMETRHAMLFGDVQERFEQRYGEFLVETGLWETFLLEAAHPDRDALPAALLAAAGQMNNNNDVRARIATGLSGVSWGRVETAIAYSDLFKQLGRKEEATETLLHAVAIARHNERALSNIIDRLASVDGQQAAMMVLNDNTDNYPALLKDSNRVIRLIAASGEDPAAAELLDKLQAASHPEARRQYNLARLAFARGEDATGYTIYQSLLVDPDVEGEWLVRVADAFESSKQQENAAAALTRLLDREQFGSEHAGAAGARLVALHTGAGQYREALQAYARIFPARRHYVTRARAALLEKATEIPFALASTELLELVASDPAHARVSDLLALRTRIAAIQNIAPPPPDCDALGVSPREQYEADLWSHIVDTWLVSPAEETRSWTEMDAPLEEGLLAVVRGTGNTETALKEWGPSAPFDVYPAVDLSKIARKQRGSSTSQQAAFALCEIESPDDRTVTLAHGSDDWSRIWINGEEVLTNAYSRVCLVDQDRVEAQLREGVNRILVKCANTRGDWEFSLSIVENGDGLRIRRPSLPGAN